jgi:Arc/MetJ-type ribon-helix-helix transcriptional regulator
MATKVTTLRLPDYMAAELAAVARADGVPVSELVRDAVARLIADRRADEDFQKRVKQLLEEDQEVLKRLAE